MVEFAGRGVGGRADVVGDALGEPPRRVGGGLGARRVMEKLVAQHDS